MPQDWFSAHAPQTPAAPLPVSSGNWFARNAPTEVQQADWSAQLGLHKPTTNRAVGFLRGAGTAAVDMLEGAASGAASTVYHGGDLIRRATGAERIIDRPQAQERMRAPDTFAGQAGQMVEQAAEFAVPLTKVSKAVQGAGILKRAGAEALASAGVAGAQSGGDAGAMAVAGAGGAVLPFAGAAVSGAGRVAQRAAAGASEGGLGGAIASAVRTVAPGNSRTMLIQALKPRSTRVNFSPSLDRAIPEIKAAEQAIGKPIENIAELVDATKVAKRQIQGQLNQIRGTAQGLEIDGSPVADAMVRSIPKKVLLENPKAAARMAASANVYRKPFALDEMEILLRETNAELDSFYQMYPQAKGKALASNPATAMLEAQARMFRESIDTGLDRMAEGGGVAAKELRRRYGALMEVEGEAVRRVNVAARQQPESLSEQIGAVRAAGEIARGTWKALHGNPMGLADIAAGVAGRSTAKAIKDSQTTDALIRRAFAGFKGQRVPVTMPTARPIAGLLPPASRRTGQGPDPSFVRSVPAMPSQSERLALPAGRGGRPMPPAADTSQVGGVRAAEMAYDIDPHATVKEGGFRVAQYSGDPKATRAVLTSTDVRQKLRQMLGDIDTFMPQRGRLVRDSLDTSDSHYAAGTAGSPVLDDIRVISGEHVGAQEIKQAIKDLLSGKMPSNKLHTAALDAAQGYIDKLPGYRGPSLPTEYLDPDDGFEAFSRAVDDLR